MEKPTDEELAHAEYLAKCCKAAGVEIRYTDDRAPTLALAMAIFRIRKEELAASQTKPIDHGTFVWVMGATGPIPQLWAPDHQPVDSKVKPLQRHPIKDEDIGRTIDELAKRYPLTSGAVAKLPTI